ncbi:hypothetical protein HYQ46_011141 [Verticillium longisporum]|nr:hypothetical protein HYQ46_011141 [Verticillium longisporum]
MGDGCRLARARHAQYQGVVLCRHDLLDGSLLIHVQACPVRNLILSRCGLESRRNQIDDQAANLTSSKYIVGHDLNKVVPHNGHAIAELVLVESVAHGLTANPALMLIRGGPFRLDFHDTSEYLIIVLVETGLAHPGIVQTPIYGNADPLLAY